MTEREILLLVRSFLEENLLFAVAPGFVLEDHESLLRRGVIDSMGVLEVLTYVESTFGIAVREDEVTEVNLGTLKSIARFVAAKRAEQNAA
jgi:acyl carrier protein